MNEQLLIVNHVFIYDTGYDTGHCERMRRRLIRFERCLPTGNHRRRRMPGSLAAGLLRGGTIER
jgi:hypothetical protein